METAVPSSRTRLPERSQNGQWNVRYRNDLKRAGVDRLRELVGHHAPWLRIRYAF